MPSEVDLSAAMTGPHAFDWILSGDKTVAPQQVFSTPLGIWLQFAAGRAVPAVFGATSQAPPVLLSHRWVAPYVFVHGAWHQLIFRAGHKEARAVRASSAAHGRALASFVDSGAPEPSDVRRTDATGEHDMSAPLAFAVGPEDNTMRDALVRWATAAGWTFGPAHWAVSFDIPLTAQAQLGTDFKAAVSALLASTEMSDRPVQPCFYSNQVLRVIAFAQQCDPRVNAQSLDFEGIDTQ